MPMNSLAIRMPEELRKQLEHEAKTDGRSLSNLIIKVLNDYIESKSEDKEKSM